MAGRRKPIEYKFRHFRADGREFTSIPLEPDVLDFFREVIDNLKSLEEKKKTTA